MVECNKCGTEIKNGKKYKIAYGCIWCIKCAEEAGKYGNFGMTYVLINNVDK